MAKTKRSGGDTITAIFRLHAVHDPEQNDRIVSACAQSRAVHNRVVAHLLEHRSDEPLHKSRRPGVTGIYGLRTVWRAEDETLRNIPLLVARSAATAATDQVTGVSTIGRQSPRLQLRYLPR